MFVSCQRLHANQFGQWGLWIEKPKSKRQVNKNTEGFTCVLEISAYRKINIDSKLS
jgi:hypothetical protein